MNEILVAYVLINRGRENEKVLAHICNLIRSSNTFLILFDESDATDIAKGLDGRSIFKSLKEIFPNITYLVSENLDVGINGICSSDLTIKNIKYELINGWDLMFPQGRSEKYKHYKLSFKVDFKNKLNNLEGLNIITAHNSAFLRPFRRAIQSISEMKEMSMLQKTYPNHLSILIRDQNTMIPGEGKFERLLRFIFKLECITDKIHWEYILDNLESDTGGLNNFAVWFNKIGGFKALKKIITIADKIESMCIKKGLDTHFNITITPKHEDIENLDHGILSINIKKIDNI